MVACRSVDSYIIVVIYTEYSILVFVGVVKSVLSVVSIQTADSFHLFPCTIFSDKHTPSVFCPCKSFSVSVNLPYIVFIGDTVNHIVNLSPVQVCKPEYSHKIESNAMISKSCDYVIEFSRLSDELLCISSESVVFISGNIRISSRARTCLVCVVNVFVYISSNEYICVVFIYSM